MEGRFEEPGNLEGEQVAVPYRPDASDPPLSDLAAAVRDDERRLLAVDGIEGVAAGDGVVVVYTRDESVAPQVPETIGDYPVEIVVTGEISAQ